MSIKGKRVATYARFSSSLQREESIQAQERAMKKYCDDNGYVIVANRNITNNQISRTITKLFGK